MSPEFQIQAVHYLPIATTVCAIVFATVLFKRYSVRRSGPHLLWWGLGVAVYGLGTAFESAITLAGNSIALKKGGTSPALFLVDIRWRKAVCTCCYRGGPRTCSA